MALALDGHATGTFSTAASGTVTLTTADTDDIIIVDIMAGMTTSAEPAVSSVTSPGLSFSRRSQTQGVISGTGWVFERWWAHAASPLSAAVITVTMGGAIDDAAILAFGVNGAHITAPWDTNAGLPAITTNNNAAGGAVPVPPVFSTTQSHDFIIGAMAFTRVNANNTNISSAYTAIDFVNNSGGTNFAGIGDKFETVSTPQSAVTGGLSSTGPSFNINIIDALTSDSSSSHAEKTIVTVGQ